MRVPTTCVCLLTVGLASAVARPEADQDPERDYKVTTYSNLVVLEVSVKDASSRYVANLPKDSFQIRENGKLQQITGFNHGDDPVTVGLVIDDSGSMRGRRIAVINAALGFIDASNSKDEVFVTHFNDRVRQGLPEGVPFSDDLELLRTSLFRNPAEGRTALYDAIVFSLHHLNQGHMEKKSLLLVSDGGDNASVRRLGDVVDAVRESQATIYTVGIYDDDDPDRNPGLLHRLADVSGGDWFRPRETEDLSGVCRQIAKDIRRRYTISYVPADSGRQVRSISVTAISSDGKKLVVRARTAYKFPAPASESVKQESVKKGR
jgi:Ca-activated chloride channel family protein